MLDNIFFCVILCTTNSIKRRFIMAYIELIKNDYDYRSEVKIWSRGQVVRSWYGYYARRSKNGETVQFCTDGIRHKIVEKEGIVTFDNVYRIFPDGSFFQQYIGTFFETICERYKWIAPDSRKIHIRYEYDENGEKNLLIKHTALNWGGVEYYTVAIPYNNNGQPCTKYVMERGRWKETGWKQYWTGFTSYYNNYPIFDRDILDAGRHDCYFDNEGNLLVVFVDAHNRYYYGDETVFIDKEEKIIRLKNGAELYFDKVVFINDKEWPNHISVQVSNEYRKYNLTMYADGSQELRDDGGLITTIDKNGLFSVCRIENKNTIFRMSVGRSPERCISDCKWAENGKLVIDKVNNKTAEGYITYEDGTKSVFVCDGNTHLVTINKQDRSVIIADFYEIYCKKYNSKGQLVFEKKGNVEKNYSFCGAAANRIDSIITRYLDSSETQKEVFDALGRKQQVTKYEKDNNVISLEKYTYYEQTSFVALVELIKNGKTFVVAHYDTNGKEDTIDYLANERVKARKQEITAKNESRPKVIRNGIQKIIATNLFNRIAKNRALRAVKKSR